ncbi:hypothetical protein D3C73_815050 [compost metagenome]
MLGIAKTALIGHGLERRTGAFQQRARRIDPRSLDELGRGDFRFPGKHPGEVARTHVGGIGQVGDGQVARQVGQHVMLHHRYRRIRFGVGCEERAELRLPARTLGEHHQPLGDAQCNFRPVIPAQ